VQVDPGACHAFDEGNSNTAYGDIVAPDLAATADVRARVQALLAQYLH
jgi:hypothetical protein